MKDIELLHGDCLEMMKKIPDNSIDCIVTSPPYNKIGLNGGKKYTYSKGCTWTRVNIEYNSYDDNMNEDDYQAWQINVLNECYRILKDDGSLFYNHKIRRLNGNAVFPIFALNSKLNLHQMIIWERAGSCDLNEEYLFPNTELVFWLSKNKPRCFKKESEFRNEVWRIVPKACSYHPAPFPIQLVKNCVLLSTKEGDTVLDPFAGSGTTGVVCKSLKRKFIGIEIDEKYCDIARQRIENGFVQEEANLTDFPLFDD